MPGGQLRVLVASPCVGRIPNSSGHDGGGEVAVCADLRSAKMNVSRNRHDAGRDGSPRIRTESTRQLSGTGSPRLRNEHEPILTRRTGNVSPSKGRRHVENSFLEALSGTQEGGEVGMWGDASDPRDNNDGSVSGQGHDGAKPDVTWTRGVSRRTTKKIQFFEPVAGEQDLFSDTGSRWSFSSIGSNSIVSSKAVPPVLGPTRSDVGPATRQVRDEDYVNDWLHLHPSRSLPPRPPMIEDDQEAFTDTGSAPDTSTDTTSIATIQEYLSRSSTAASTTHLLYKKSKSAAAELAEELLANSHMLGKLRIRNFDAPDHDSNDATIAYLDADDETYEYTSIVERLRQAELGLITPQPVAREVRSAAKHSELARKALSEAGAIPPLLRLLMPDHEMGTRHTAALALLNLAIGSTRNKMAIYEEGGVPMLIDLLRPESSISLRESATAVMLSLAASDHLKPHLENAIPHLVDILKNGTTQGRSDACRALLNLSIFKPNRPKIVTAGAIPPLYMLVLRDCAEAADKGVLLLGHLYSTQEGREAMASAPQTFSVLLHLLKVGSQPSKEQAAGILLSLSSDPEFRQKTVAAQGILPSLVEMALVGSQKAQDRASRLLEMMKNHRSLEGVALVESKPRRRRATSLSGVEELASKVKEAEVRAAVEVVASAIEEEASADWRDDDAASSSTPTPLAGGASFKDASTTAEVIAGTSESPSADLIQKQEKKGWNRRGSSFSGSSSLVQKDAEISSSGAAIVSDQKCKPKTHGKKKADRNQESAKRDGKSANILLSLRSFWSRHKWESGCKGGIP